jgi:ribose/xylose/arabinose/galactoside ABC-type transport system permease subunit
VALQADFHGADGIMPGGHIDISILWIVHMFAAWTMTIFTMNGRFNPCLRTHVTGKVTAITCVRSRYQVIVLGPCIMIPVVKYFIGFPVGILCIPQVISNAVILHSIPLL